MPNRPLIALDCDGVLLDFHLGYAAAWKRAFGVNLVERDRLAYWPMDRWEAERLTPEGRSAFRAAFDTEFWTTLVPIPGAAAACRRLHAAGYELICVSALDSEFAAARLQNLRDHGFPIEQVIATGHHEGARSPKADAIDLLDPVAFVDDYIAYMRGIPRHIHAALVTRAPNGSPNVGPDLALAHSVHPDLSAFADYWLSR